MNIRNDLIWEPDRSNFVSVYAEQSESNTSAIPEKVKGYLEYNGNIYPFSLTRQADGSKYALRGKVYALNALGAKAKRKEKVPCEEGTMVAEIVIESSLYTNSCDEESLKRYIYEKIVKLYTENSLVLNSSASHASRPSTIRPMQAYAIHSREFFVDVFGAVSEMKNEQLKRACAALPNTSMAQLTKKEVNDAVKKYCLSKELIKLLSQFWQYCCGRGYCTGECRINIPRKGTQSAKSKQNKLRRKEFLTQDEQDQLFDYLESNLNGISVGIALRLSGIAAKDVVELNWDDFTFSDLIDDYVIIRIIDETRKDATKNISRPLHPRTALILRAYRDFLAEKYGDQFEETFPVSMFSNPMHRISPNRINDESKRIVLGCKFLTGADIANLTGSEPNIAAMSVLFNNSYSNSIENVCHLSHESFEFKYLTAQSFGMDTSLDAYISLTTKESLEHAYTLMAPLRKKVNFSEIPAVDLVDGSHVITAVPSNNRRIAVQNAEIWLEDGEIIEIGDPFFHGAKISIECQEITD